MPTPESRSKLFAIVVFCQVLGTGAAGAQDGRVVAGLAPQARPEGAPVLAAFSQSADWRDRALSGVNKPHPPGLAFLSSQGAWYTPFIHSGMTGPYDLRGWHVRDKEVAGVRQAGDK